MERSGGIGRTIQELSTRVAEIYRFGVNDRAVAFLWLVVNHSRVGTGRRNSIERQTDKPFMLPTGMLSFG